MAEDTSKVPVQTDKTTSSALHPWRPLESLRREIDQLFDDFGLGTWRSPFRRSFFDMDRLRRAKAAFTGMPAVDVTETENGYEVVAELPGVDEKNIEVKVANGILTISGQKREEKEETKKDYANAGLVHSNARSRCPRELTSIRLTPASRKAC